MNNSHAGPLALGAMLRVEGILAARRPKLLKCGQLVKTGARTG